MKAATEWIFSERDRRILFQSTPPVKAATTSLGCKSPYFAISIHAAREGGDCFGVLDTPTPEDISIHAAREGGDPVMIALYNDVFDFNPRRP